MGLCVCAKYLFRTSVRGKGTKIFKLYRILGIFRPRVTSITGGWKHLDYASRSDYGVMRDFRLLQEVFSACFDMRGTAEEREELGS